MTERNIRLCYVVSSEMTVSAFLKDHIAAAIADGYEVSVVANSIDNDFLQRLGLSAVFHPVEITRSIAPWRDMMALLNLLRLFRIERFDIVHSVSPKAGMLAMLAARMAGIPNCIHTFTGQVWVTRHGIKRWMLKVADYVLAGLTTQALVDSPSQRDFLLTEGVVLAKKTKVIGNGAICGVNGDRFRPNSAARHELREHMGIPQAAPLLLYLGRLNRDKGVLDLAYAFVRIASRFPEVRLLIVGPDEGDLTKSVAEICATVIARVHFVDYTTQPERFMAASDVFCLPSHREGFGMVIIEAAATGVPTVASRIYGVIDAIVEGHTGLLHPPGNVDAIVQQISRLLIDPELCREMGTHARSRALADFSREALSKGLLAFYEKMVC